MAALLRREVAKAYHTARGAISHPRVSRRLRWLRRSWRPIAWVVGFLCLVATLSLYPPDRDGLLSAVGRSSSGLSKKQFIDAVLREPIEGAIDPAPIRQKCDEIVFQEGLVWHCAALAGGIGTAANMWLNCVRYAMEAGATTLILPRIRVRADNLVDMGNEATAAELSTMFDTAFFLDSWKEACPQMKAVVAESEDLNLAPIRSAPRITPHKLTKLDMSKHVVVNQTEWRQAFDEWASMNGAIFTTKNPVRIWQEQALAQWNRETHSQQFVNSFPRLFRHSNQTRRLAASVLWKLDRKLGRPIVAEAITHASNPPTKVTSLQPNRLVPAGFLGAHMRVAKDAAAAGWPGYDLQAPHYISEAKRLHLNTIYLATGSPEHRDKFREDAARDGLNVIVKEDLLKGQELLQLKAMTWDQQSLVDYDVLMYSTQFYGFARSNFSWSVAMRRGVLPDAGAPAMTEEDEYRDDISAVASRFGDIKRQGIWP